MKNLEKLDTSKDIPQDVVDKESRDESFDLQEVEKRRQRFKKQQIEGNKEPVLSRRSFLKGMVGLGASAITSDAVAGVKALESLAKKIVPESGVENTEAMFAHHKQDLLRVLQRKDVTTEQKGIISRIISGEEVVNFSNDKNFPAGNFLVEQQKIRDLQRSGEMASMNASRDLQLPFDEINDGYPQKQEKNTNSPTQFSLINLAFLRATNKDVQDWSLYIKDTKEWERQKRVWQKNNELGWQNIDPETGKYTDNKDAFFDKVENIE